MGSLRFALIATAYFCTVYGLESIQEPSEHVVLNETSLNETIIKLIIETARSSRCKLRETVVKLDTGFGLEVFPQRVVVNRCGGISGPNKMSCVPTETGVRMMAVTGVGATNSDKIFTVEVVEHKKCMVMCTVREEDCGENQTYDVAHCKCN